MTDSKWHTCLLAPHNSLMEAIQVINNSSLQVGLVVDGDTKLLGTVTDGDIRRAILRNVALTDPVSNIMCENCTVASDHDSHEAILSLMKRSELSNIPVVDGTGRLVGLKTLMQMVEAERVENWAVLMAGGQGSRLRPITEHSPKPLLTVGDKPLLETIIERLSEHGLHRFFISLNYKGGLIEEYFGDGSKWNIEITYLRETSELGTAGALSLLPGRPPCPLLVMNGDLLTKINIRQLLNFHTENNSDATMCVREYDFEVPYGVVNTDGHRLIKLEEKPVQSFFVNAGIYVLEPAVLDLVPEKTSFDMPTLFQKMLDLQKSVSIFPVHEYWLDIGRLTDYERANGDYHKHFTSS